MLGARGVSLGLGKINLSDLNQLPGERQLQAAINRKQAREAKEAKALRPRIIIKKKADAKTVWAACRAVIFGCIVIAIGLAMTALGYFDRHLSTHEVEINGTKVEKVDKLIGYQLKSMQYVGPILMGIGTFVLIIACVITLESRDKHAQVIQEESQEMRKQRLHSDSAACPLVATATEIAVEDKPKCPRQTTVVVAPELHRVPSYPPRCAPLAAVDESLLDLPSQCNQDNNHEQSSSTTQC